MQPFSFFSPFMEPFSAPIVDDPCPMLASLPVPAWPGGLEGLDIAGDASCAPCELAVEGDVCAVDATANSNAVPNARHKCFIFALLIRSEWNRSLFSPNTVLCDCSLCLMRRKWQGCRLQVGTGIVC